MRQIFKYLLKTLQRYKLFFNLARFLRFFFIILTCIMH
uniref:Uncharacterized protein n=1 Tax=Siphoviridae sp. ctmHK36 TaxID=2827931 RepID=A0A8S5TBL2_9CAUD|nr:MAG TPA: hypothetical protein [Siphoviridae sp. ctmHK36]